LKSVVRYLFLHSCGQNTEVTWAEVPLRIFFVFNAKTTVQVLSDSYYGYKSWG